MKTKQALVITMSIPELNLRFKNFLKERCQYDDKLITSIDTNDDNEVVIEVKIGDFTEEQEEIMSELEIELSTPCPPALGMDLFYSMFGADAELINVENGVKIIQYQNCIK